MTLQSMEEAKIDPEEHTTYNTNNERVAIETPEVSSPPDDSAPKKFSSKNALAMVMDFSILSNSTVMLIDVIQQWKLTEHEPILTTLLVMLPIIMFIQLPVAVIVVLSGHGNYSENTRRHFHNWILALLSFSTALMLVSDLLKVKVDANRIIVAPVNRSQE